MKKIKNLFEKFAFFSLALAQQYAPPEFEHPEDLVDRINAILRWVVTLLIVLSAIFIAMAGFNYVTSGGEEDKISKAKTQLVYGLVGVAIAALAYALPRVIYHIVSG
ncbi:hypothetical protein J7K91_02370 [bacterium]|nr:hypothetical protein [bacterium]